MLRAMDELEKTVVDLLERLQKPDVCEPSSVKNRAGEPDKRMEEREQEAAELVRRALLRLKSL